MPPLRPLCLYLALFVFVDGLTHWSLTGSTMTDEDTFMGFSDGLSQSGILHSYQIWASYIRISCFLSSFWTTTQIWYWTLKLKCRIQITISYNLFLFVPSGVSRGGDDSLWSSDLHPSWGCGLCPACGQMALPAEECFGWLLLHTGISLGFSPATCSSIILHSN